jgi:DnaJ family protein A protein 2
MSLYERLGVSRTASSDEIKRSYRDLARSKHPDKGGSAAEFQAIQEAHEVLSDDRKRQMYDMTGDINDVTSSAGETAGGIPFSFMGGMGPFGMPGMSFDMGGLGGLFGMPQAAPGRSVRPRGPNKQHDIGLPLHLLYKGHQVHLKMNQARKCNSCKGKGAETWTSCSACKGQGRRTELRMIGPGIMAQSTGPCEPCGGEGKTVQSVCKGCNGKKFLDQEKILEVKITPGMKEGETIVFAGECSESAEFESPGDVVLTIRRTDPETGWIVQGSDLRLQQTVSYAEAMMGVSFRLKDHPSGKSPLFVWNKGPLLHGSVLRAKGWGMRTPSSSPQGKGIGVLIDEKEGDALIEILVTAPEARAWRPEELLMLQTVFQHTPVAPPTDVEVVSLE